MSVASHRFALTLFVGADIRSHWLRLVVAEKKLTADIRELPVEELPADVLAQNPYGSLPVLVDRDICLHDARVAMEYVDERFPQPPLQPPGPVERARQRQLAGRIEREWCRLAELILNGSGGAEAVRLRKHLRESLMTVSPLFNDLPYFMSQDFTLLDCMLAPIMWRLPQLGLELPEKPCKGLLRYRERLMARPGFQQSIRSVVAREEWS